MPTKILSVRVEEEDYKKLLGKAEATGKRISDFSREIIENRLSATQIFTDMELAQLIKLIAKLNQNAKLIAIGESVMKNVKRDENGEPIRNEKGIVQLTGSMELFTHVDEYLSKHGDK